MTDLPDDFDAGAIALHVALSLKGWTLFRRNTNNAYDFHGWCLGPDWTAADWTIYYDDRTPLQYRLKFWDMAGRFTVGAFEWFFDDHIELLKTLNTEMPWVAAGNHPRGAREDI